MRGEATIFALSTGSLPSGVAVVRITGAQARFALETIAGPALRPRTAALRELRDPRTGSVLDRALVLWFPGPSSFTGEDCAEFHVHGGRAVVSAVLEALGALPGLRLAEPGEFSRRAFENGKLDLTEIEGLSDLIAARTEAQRRHAVRQAGGAMRRQLEAWRMEIVRLRAMVEAELDFSDEEDVPQSVAAKVWPDADSLSKQIRSALDDGRRGEIVREGFEIVLLGPPNAGKSSLLNALVRRDVAIVSEEAGTTRDLVEAHLDMDGHQAIVVDTAGLREMAGPVESEGMRRARARARDADLAIWLQPPDDDSPPEQAGPVELLVFRSKDDSGAHGGSGLSVIRSEGLDPLLEAIRARLAQLESGEPPLVTRERHRVALRECAEALESAAKRSDLAIELRAEELRAAAEALGRITGRVDVEDLLDVIFGEFCIGK